MPQQNKVQNPQFGFTVAPCGIIFLWVLYSYAHACCTLLSVLPPLHGCYACDSCLLLGVRHIESIAESGAHEDGLGAVECGVP